MTRTAAGIYTYQTDVNKQVDGYLIIRGLPDGSEFYNKSGDLTVTSSHTKVLDANSMNAGY